jgi:mono/diheme cytochrome c family protein
MSARSTALAALFPLALSLVTACSKEAPKQEATPAPVAAPAPKPVDTTPSVPFVSEAEAQKAFVGRCAACHGTTGKGDGPGAAALNPKPRNYTDKEWQKSVTDDQIAKTIMYGGAAVGKSPNMPAQPDLSSKPEMVAALVKVVRSFAKNSP